MADNTIALDLPLVGVKILKDSTGGFEGVTRYRGASYCDAVKRATLGEALVVEPGGIEVCRWSPIVLGLKAPENSFERGLEPTLVGTQAVFVARLEQFGEGVEPDVVIVRGSLARLFEVAGAIGPGGLQERYRGNIGWSALGVAERGRSFRVALSRASNRALGRLAQWTRFDDLTRVVFKSPRACAAFEAFGKRNTVADMSVCRNSTVIPYVEGAGNISFFCTGGVSWGGNSPWQATSGYPYGVIGPVLDRLEWTGKK